MGHGTEISIQIRKDKERSKFLWDYLLTKNDHYSESIWQTVRRCYINLSSYIFTPKRLQHCNATTYIACSFHMVQFSLMGHLRCAVLPIKVDKGIIFATLRCLCSLRWCRLGEMVKTQLNHLFLPPPNCRCKPNPTKYNTYMF